MKTAVMVLLTILFMSPLAVMHFYARAFVEAAERPAEECTKAKPRPGASAEAVTVMRAA